MLIFNTALTCDCSTVCRNRTLVISKYKISRIIKNTAGARKQYWLVECQSWGQWNGTGRTIQSQSKDFCIHWGGVGSAQVCRTKGKPKCASCRKIMTQNQQGLVCHMATLGRGDSKTIPTGFSWVSSSTLPVYHSERNSLTPMVRDFPRLF